MNLSVQCRELCNTYVKEKRDGYIQVGFSSPGITDAAVKSLFYTFLFVIAKIGIAFMEPLYREYGSDQNKKREKVFLISMIKYLTHKLYKKYG